MANATVDVGTGTTIAFGTSGFSANLLSIDWDGIERAAPETSHMGSTKDADAEFGSRTFMAGDLANAGEVTATFQFNPDTTPPVGTVETITVTYPLASGDTTPANWAFSGFMREYGAVAALEDVMECTAVIRAKTGVTITAAA